MRQGWRSWSHRCPGSPEMPLGWVLVNLSRSDENTGLHLTLRGRYSDVESLTNFLFYKMVRYYLVGEQVWHHSPGALQVTYDIHLTKYLHYIYITYLWTFHLLPLISPPKSLELTRLPRRQSIVNLIQMARHMSFLKTTVQIVNWVYCWGNMRHFQLSEKG